MWASCDLHRLIKQQKMKKKKKKKKINKKCKAEKARCWKHQKQKKLRLVFQALVLLFLWFGVLPEWNRSEKLHPRLDGRHIKAQPVVWSRCHYQTLEWPRSVDGTHSLSFTWTCEIPSCVCVWCDFNTAEKQKGNDLWWKGKQWLSRTLSYSSALPERQYNVKEK